MRFSPLAHGDFALRPFSMLSVSDPAFHFCPFILAPNEIDRYGLLLAHEEGSEFFAWTVFIFPSFVLISDSSPALTSCRVVTPIGMSSLPRQCPDLDRPLCFSKGKLYYMGHVPASPYFPRSMSFLYGFFLRAILPIFLTLYEIISSLVFSPFPLASAWHFSPPCF